MQADTEFLAEREKQLSEWRNWLAAKKAAVEEREAFARQQLGNRCVRSLLGWFEGRLAVQEKEREAFAARKQLGNRCARCVVCFAVVWAGCVEQG